MIDKIAYAFDKLRITRRIGFYFTLWLTYKCITISYEITMDGGFSGIEVGGIIAAIMVPVTTLQGYIMKAHHRGHEHAPSPKAPEV